MYESVHSCNGETCEQYTREYATLCTPTYYTFMSMVGKMVSLICRAAVDQESFRHRIRRSVVHYFILYNIILHIYEHQNSLIRKKNAQKRCDRWRATKSNAE